MIVPCLWSLRRLPLLRTAIALGTTIFVVMVLPVMRNPVFGDPLSPILNVSSAARTR
jgi:hypothetical protein